MQATVADSTTPEVDNRMVAAAVEDTETNNPVAAAAAEAAGRYCLARTQQAWPCAYCRANERKTDREADGLIERRRKGGNVRNDIGCNLDGNPAKTLPRQCVQGGFA